MSSIVQKSGEKCRASARGAWFGLRLILLLASLALVVQTARAQAPVNDDFTNAAVIVGPDGFFQGSNVGATRETNEPIHYIGSPFSSNSVWFSWTAPSNGVVTFDTIGTYYNGNFTNVFGFLDTVLAAYRPNGTNGLTNLVRLASDDDSGGNYDSLLSFNAQAGTNYLIALDGYRYGRFGSTFGSSGPYRLHWTMGGTPPIFIPPDLIQFSSPTYSVSENQLFANITLWYGGDSSGGTLGDVSVDLFTTNGTAIAGTNYVGTNVTVIFAPGETLKTITIPIIINDFAANLDRTVFLGLANPTHATITNAFQYLNSAVLTILDDDRQFQGSAGSFYFSSSYYYGTENETDPALGSFVGGGVILPSVDRSFSPIIRDVNLPAVAHRSPYGVVVMVNRSAPAVGRVMVDYSTEVTGTNTSGPIFGIGGTFAAKSGVDFSPVSGTLVFDDYQMSASFLVPVFSNFVSNNADAVFDVVLSNPRPAPEEVLGAVVPLLPSLSSPSRATVEVLEVNERFKTFNFERALYRYDEYNPLQNTIPSTNGTRTITVDVLLPGGGGGSVTVRMLHNTTETYLYALQAGSDYATLDQDTFFNTPYTDGRPPIVNEPDFGDFQSATINFPSQGPDQFRQRATFTITNDNTVEFNEDVRFDLRNIPQGFSAGPNLESSVTILYDDQPAGAADREWNPEGIYYTQPPFNTTPGANNSVSALVVQDDSRTVIVGDFTAVNTVSRNRVARLNPNGSVDTTFNPGTGADNFIETIALYPNSLANPAQAGKLVVGGGFTSMNNISRRGIARLNPDGSLDATFNPGNGADGTVHSVALQSDGKILVAGDFTHFNDLPVSGIMRLNEDGTLDTTFNPGTGANGTVWRVAVRDSVTSFTIPRGSAASQDRNVIDTGSTQGIIVVNYDFGFGADNIRIYYEGQRILDVTAITNGQVAVPYGPGTATSVEIVMNEATTGGDWSYQATITPAVASRSIYLAGEFTSFSGLPLRRVARLLNDGSVDSSFNPGVSVNGPVYAMAVQPNNRVLLGGAFSQFHNSSRNSLVRLLGNGALDLDFHVGTGADDSIYAITLEPDNKIFIGGVFQSYNGTRRMGIARLFGNGALDTSFMDTAYNQFAGLIKTFSFDPPRYVNAIGLQPDGNVMIGGSFTKLGGNFSYDHPGYATERLHAPFTRADKVTRFNIARLIGGYTDGPGNIEFDPAATTFSVDENSGTFSAPLRRVDGRLGSAYTSSDIVFNTATTSDVSGSIFSPTWQEMAFVAPVSIGFTGFRYFQIPIFDDNLREGNETFDLSTANVGGSVTLGNSFFFFGGFFGSGGEYIPLGAARGYNDSVKVTIADNEFDRGEFNFAQPNFVVDENSGLATITVIRTNGSSGPVDVRVLVMNGTALAGQDYNAPTSTQTLAFASGQTVSTFTVSLIDNPQVEPDETVILVLTNATGGATLPGGFPYSTATATLTIIDNDFQAGRLNFSETNYAVSEAGTQAVVTVTRNGGNQGLLSVQYSTFDGSATAPADYSARNGTLTWNSGDSSPRTILVPLVADGLVEGPETVELRLSNPTVAGALGDRTNATLTILDGDAYGALSFSQPYYNVGENDSSPIITVVRNGGIGGIISVNFYTFAISATSGLDYINTNGVLTFLPGELSKTFQVPVLDDTDIDGDKTFGISLSSPVNASLGAISDVVVTLVDNESANTPAGSLDTAFSANSSANGAVYALALQTNGAIIMAGDFTEVGSVPRSHLARLDANGVLDQAFDIGPGANGSIRTLALQSDGRLLIGGLFTTINGTNRSRLARLSIDGKLDAAFDPGAGADNPVLALSVQGDDKVLVGGSFSSFRGVSSPGLIRLNTNGTTDASFNVGAGINGTVYAIELQGDGKVLVGGNFISYNGVPRTNLIRLNINGSLDLSFNPALAITAPVLAILAEPDGRIVIGGSFTNVNGFNRRFLARLDRAGSVDPAFLAAAGAGADNVVYAIQQQVDGKLMVGGDFRRFNGVTRHGITRLNDADGTTDPTINFGEGANAFVAALVIQPDRKIVLGGGFNEYDGQPRQFLARIYGGSISGPGTLEFGHPEFLASETGTNAVITVRRRGGTTGAVSAHYATSDGTAISGQDYLGNAGNLVFAEGETFQSFSVQILPNSLADGDRTVLAELSNFVGAAPGLQPSTTLVILDDENTVRFTASEYSIGENPVSGNATIGVFRGGGTNTTVTVDFATGTGNATAGLDYVATNGTLVFLPGEVFKNFNVRILDDAFTDGNETVPLSLVNPSAGTSLSVASAILVIVDNDFTPGQFLFSTNNFVAGEGSGGAVVTVLRTNGSSGPVSVRLRTSNGSAISGLDYIDTDRVVTFADGESVKTVPIPVIDDSVVEANDVFTVTLSDPSPGTSILASNAIVTIADNDAGIIVGAGTALVSESLIPANSVIDPGETVTVLFALRNAGVVDAGGVTATLVYTNGITYTNAQTQTYGNLTVGGNSVSRPFTFTAQGTNGSLVRATFIITNNGSFFTTISFDFVLGRPAIPFLNAAPITINDNGPASPYPSTLSISNVSGAVNHLTVTLYGVTHRYPDDLDIVLVGPNGAQVMLMSDAGGGNPNELNNATIMFDDFAARVIPDGTVITNGSYRPANYLTQSDPFPAPGPTAPYSTTLSSFDGSSPNGLWSLYIVDDSATDSGTILGGWSLNIVNTNVVLTEADLSVSVSDAPDPVSAGGPITYTIAVTNHGPGSATSVALTNLLPVGVSLLDVSGPGSYALVGNVLSHGLGSLPMGSGLVVTVTVIAPSTAALLTFDATVSAGQPDINSANSHVSIQTSVTGGTPVVPMLFGARSNGQFVLSWQSTSTKIVLQATPLLNPGAWVPAGITPVTNNGISTVTVPIDPGARYFRLQYIP